IKPMHKHLYAFLSSSKPTKFEDGKLYIEVPFQFYKDQIDCPKSKNAISKILKDLFQIPEGFICIVNEKAKPRMKSTPDVVLERVPAKKKQTVSNEKRSFSTKKITPDLEAIFEGM
ncbi:MAG: hypothetical protein PHP08_01200, partial [Candidatus Dojkabacteria bacterium]|nr:hypothetical protein [Candidatus Dojkabacteria bacterium]